ncbi:MAG: HIT family protein [Pyrobaculum sp.]
MDFRVVLTPWRLKYLQDIGRGGCFLCKAASEHNDDENLIPARGEKAFVILNKYPYTWGHVMVAPYRHISQFEELEAGEWVEIIQLAREITEAVKKVTGAQRLVTGLNVGRAAGAGLEGHLHLHIIPLDTEVGEREDLHKSLVELTRELRRCLERSA